MEQREVVVIGGGPGGYVAAIRAAQLGVKVTLVEEKKLGGTCLNCGCIPTKFMLRSVETYQSIKDAEQYGISVADINFDLAKMQARKNKVISTLVSGVNGLLRGNKIEVISGRARLIPSKQIEIDAGQGKKQTIQAEKIVIVTGAKPIVLPIPGIDSPDILDAEAMLELEQLPQSLAIIGGGVIGVELAIVWAKLGCNISLVEMMPHCLPTQDVEVANILQKALAEDGVRIHCNARVTKVENVKGGKAVVFSGGEAEQKIEVEKVAVSVGYLPNVAGLGLEECGIACDKGGIKVNERMQTNVPDIYAAGDVVGGMMLAYVAIKEGLVAAENALGRNSKIEYQAIPQCIFTLPEVASVGLTEEEAVAQGYEIQVGRFPFAASGMAMIMGEQRGLVKIISERKYGQLLGVHIVGTHATGLIAEAAIAMKLESTYEDIITTTHAHPSLSEALWEAALDVGGRALHSPPRKRGN